MDNIRFTHDHVVIDHILSNHVETAQQNRKSALAADPLMITTARINRR
jgi:hypothetical protein